MMDPFQEKGGLISDFGHFILKGVLTHFLALVTGINTNMCYVCPSDLELFKWADYLGQRVLSGFLFAF